MVKVREQLGKYLGHLILFTAIFFLILLISGIWHCVYASIVHDDFYSYIAGRIPFQISVSIGVLDLGSIIVIFIMILICYLIGQKFYIHLASLILAIATTLACFVLTIVNLVFSTPGAQDIYADRIRDRLKTDFGNPIVQKWMKKYNCSDNATCEKHIVSYVTFRCQGEMIACSVTVGIFLIACIGITISVLQMGCITRPQEDNHNNDIINPSISSENSQNGEVPVTV